MAGHRRRAGVPLQSCLKAERRRAYRAGKLAGATTPALRAGVAWDFLRADVSELPEDHQSEAWAQVTTVIDTLRRTLTGGDGL